MPVSEKLRQAYARARMEQVSEGGGMFGRRGDIDPNKLYGSNTPAICAFNAARAEVSDDLSPSDIVWDDETTDRDSFSDKVSEMIYVCPDTGLVILLELHADTDHNPFDDDTLGTYDQRDKGSGLALTVEGERHRPTHHQDRRGTDNLWFNPKCWDRGDTAGYLRAHGCPKHLADCRDRATLISIWENAEDWLSGNRQAYGIRARCYPPGTEPDAMADATPLADDSCWGYDVDGSDDRYLKDAALDHLNIVYAEGEKWVEDERTESERVAAADKVERERAQWAEGARASE